MKILYTNFHTSPGIGGHTSYISRLIAGLAPHHDIGVAVPAQSALYRIANAMTGVQTYAQDYPSKLPQLPAAAAHLRNILRNGQYDVVHVNGTADHRLVMLAMLGLRRKPAIIFTKHNDHATDSIGSRLRARFGTDHCIAVCDFVADQLAGGPYDRAGITTVHNGINTDYFSAHNGGDFRSMRQSILGSAEDSRILLGSNAGTTEYKGWIDMVRALAQLDPRQIDRLHIAVAGPRAPQKLLDEVQQLGMNRHISFVGDLDDVRPFIAAIDVGFVLSYRVETISFACREMMAMGKPVIVTRQGGLPENIDADTDGWVIPPRDPQALAALLAQIVQGHYDLRAMGLAARSKSELRFDQEKFISATETVYRQALQSRARPHQAATIS
ncbi:transferase [Advenella kashmirensis WT001]|uniref:Transferase n=1 Tax=Advenella kashmirensis (strain DSM 17095 / LMG 22695 / WT001) TaxID=1036672 RepID=I3UGI5_ADVKW|nr:glycosyltransferase family 4 protein [Advenella kashmirensis]AFK64123.1 transferase [Advenella kashmirensis WT001]